MADKRIDQLTAATSLGDSDLFVVEQSSAAKKATGTVVSNYINSKFGLTGMANNISALQTAVAGKQDALTFPIPISQGGTGATTVGNARVNLGLGTAAVANIDATLSVQGAAADAKAVGDGINDIESTILFDASSSLTWAVGAISSSDGADSTSTTRIRTNSYIPVSTSLISVESGYKYMLFAYNNGSYVGTWNGTNFVKSGNWRTASLYMKSLPNYDYKLVFADENGTAMSVDYATNIHVMAYTDESLSIAGKSADAKSTGDAIDGLKDYQSAAFFSRTTSFTGVNYKKVDDFHLEIYGTATASSTRFINLINGSAQLLSTSSTPTKSIPAGTYKFNVQFTGYNSTGLMYIIPNTTASGIIRIDDGAVVKMDSPFTVGIQVPTGVNWGTSSAPTYLHFEAKSIGTIDQYTLYPTGDQSDRTADIMTTLKSFGKCVLTKGEYFINEMQMPSYTTLEGCGRGTILRPPAGATGAVVKLERGCTVKDLKIIGLSGESFEPDQGTIGTNHGISANGISGSDYTDRLRLIIEAVEIAGFDGAGIYLYNTGGNINDGASISDCCVHNCEVGLYTKNSEYHRVSNSSFNACYYGTFNDGSNNVFSNCGFNGCAIGAYLENVDGTVGNHAAGTFSSCTFHHFHSTAIKIEGAGNNYVSQGEIFIGCEIGYGNVEITNGQGIHFSSCSFFNNAPISISDEGTNSTHTFVLFSTCLFRNAEQNPVTKTGTATVLFENCHLRSTGGAFNPS